MKILFHDKRPYVQNAPCNYYSEIVDAIKLNHHVAFIHSDIKKISELGNNYDLLLLGFAHTDVGGKDPAPIINDVQKPIGIILNKEYDVLDKKLNWIKNIRPSFVLTIHHDTENMTRITNVPVHRIMWSTMTNLFKDYKKPYLYDFVISGVIRKEQTNDWRRQIYNTLNRIERKNYKVFKSVKLQEKNFQGESLSPIDYANLLSASKIFLSTTSPADLISTRYFEAMATNRTLIITNRMPKHVFENYLIEDFNCIMFETLDEFYEKVLYYLSHEEERLKIVNTAFTYFSENLTWKKQSDNMTNIFHNYCPQTN